MSETTTQLSLAPTVDLNVTSTAVGNKKQRHIFHQTGGIYFYSSMIAGKKSVFVTPEYLDLLTNAFKLAELRFDIKNLAYVIMPNHFYWIFRLSEKSDDPVPVYREVKKSVGSEIIKNLFEEIKNPDTLGFKTVDLFANNEKVNRHHAKLLLWTFREEAKKLDLKQRYRVWDLDSQLFWINNESSLSKQLKFISNAPLRENWQLVDKAEDYPYLYLSEEVQKLLA